MRGLANKLVLYLDDDLAKALLSMAQANERTPVKQAVWVLREEAKREGRLPLDTTNAQAAQAVQREQ